MKKKKTIEIKKEQELPKLTEIKKVVEEKQPEITEEDINSRFYISGSVKRLR